ncbi:MAG: hypothetical protein ACI4AE_07520, partial [Candidatus Cryptobacteroides sp.]
MHKVKVVQSLKCSNIRLFLEKTSVFPIPISAKRGILRNGCNTFRGFAAMGMFAFLNPFLCNVKRQQTQTQKQTDIMNTKAFLTLSMRHPISVSQSSVS